MNCSSTSTVCSSRIGPCRRVSLRRPCCQRPRGLKRFVAMTLAALTFALGAALLQWQSALPPAWWALSLPVLGSLAFLRPRTVFIFTFALGFLWAALLAHVPMWDWLAPELEGRGGR